MPPPTASPPGWSDRQPVEAEEFDPAAADLHAGDQGDRGQHGPGDRRPGQRRDRVAGDDPVAVGGGEQVAVGEADLEVAGDAEAGEDAAEGRRLQQHEDELEGGVAAGEVEAGHVADRREAAGEGDEEEEREDDRRRQEGRVGEEVVDAAPGDRARDRAEAGRPRFPRSRSCPHQPRLHRAAGGEHADDQHRRGDAEAERQRSGVPAFEEQQRKASSR